MSTRPRDIVSASEIAAWEWCSESWRLEALGKERSNKEELARGESFHARTAAVEVWSRRAVALAVAALLLSLSVAAVGLALLGSGDR
jgi:hypothetical protein